MKYLILVCGFGLLSISVILLSSSPSPGSKSVGGSGGEAEVKVVTLDDGTKCAILVGYSKGAISCNWK